MSRPRPAATAGRRAERGRVAVVQAATLLALVGGWEAAVRAGWLDPLFVPAPGDVLRSLGGIADTASAALGDTLAKTAVAYVLAVALGVPGGLVLGSTRLLGPTLNPFVVAAYGMPKILVLPWIVLLLGFGAAPAIAYGALHGVFPILVLVMSAVRDVDPQLVTVARAYGARPWQIYRTVILPAIVPAILASLRLGIVFCLLGVLIVEMFAGVRGMGYLMGALANGFRAAELFAATALVSVASIALVLVLDALNDRLSRWRG